MNDKNNSNKKSIILGLLFLLLFLTLIIISYNVPLVDLILGILLGGIIIFFIERSRKKYRKDN